MAGWTAEQLSFLRDVIEVRIAPLQADGTPWPGRLIWVLEVDGRVWARSWKGADAQWYRRARETDRARLTTDDDAFNVVVELRPDQDAETASAIDAEFLRKYGEPYAKEMNLPLAAETTIELLPVD
jgi:hypothetical protein